MQLRLCNPQLNKLFIKRTAEREVASIRGSFDVAVC